MQYRTTWFRLKQWTAVAAMSAALVIGALSATGATASAAPRVSSTSSSSCAYTITAKAGDWLSKLAPQTWRQLVVTNQIATPSRIYPGEKFCITYAEARGMDITRLHPVVVTHAVAVKKTKTTKSSKQSSGSVGSTSTPTHGSPAGPVSGNLGPCGGNYGWSVAPSLWAAPLGCFGRIFSPSAVSTRAWASPGYCNWVVEALHGTNNLWGLRRSYAHPGAAIFFSGGVYGASSGGHWANVVSVHGGWMLIIEENFTWRGGGFGRIDYRYVPLGGGETFLG